MECFDPSVTFTPFRTILLMEVLVILNFIRASDDSLIVVQASGASCFSGDVRRQIVVHTRCTPPPKFDKLEYRIASIWFFVVTLVLTE